MKVAVHAKLQSRRSRGKFSVILPAIEPHLPLMHLRERPMYYRMNADHTTIPIIGRPGDPNHTDAALEWSRDFEQFEHRQIAEDVIEGCRVSTIFLGLDHAFGMGPPMLFETMAFTAASRMMKLFGDREREIHEELEERRYSTYDEAMAGHAEVVANVRATVEMINALKGKT